MRDNFIELPDFPYKHGFGDAKCAISKEYLTDDMLRVKEMLHVREIYWLEQTHSSKCVCVENAKELSQGDALIADKRIHKAPLALCVYTADCVPLLIASDDIVSIVHAGWRGIAEGILENVCDELTQRAKGAVFDLAFGPCAGAKSYEVGEEVVAALGEQAVYSDSDQKGKYLLDLQQSCLARLSSLPIRTVSQSKICTVTQSDYCSYRREGHGPMRNLSFIASGSSQLL